jgi:hypothetical protein
MNTLALEASISPKVRGSRRGRDMNTMAFMEASIPPKVGGSRRGREMKTMAFMEGFPAWEKYEDDGIHGEGSKTKIIDII